MNTIIMSYPKLWKTIIMSYPHIENPIVMSHPIPSDNNNNVSH